MSEILVHAFGNDTCEIHVTKLASTTESGGFVYVAAAFVHQGPDRKRAIADAHGVEIRTAGADRAGTIAKMVDYLSDRFGAFNARGKAIDLRRRPQEPPLSDERSGETVH